MKLSELIAGAALILGGTGLYYQNWKQPGSEARRRALCGLGLVIAGTFLATGRWMMELILSGN